MLTDNKKENETKFWAKTNLEGEPSISVADHMLIVGMVAKQLSETYSNVLTRFSLHSGLIGALSALHDLGKISPGFQRKCFRWLEQTHLVDLEKKWDWSAIMEPDHGKVSHSAIQTFLKDKGFSRSNSSHIATVLGGHHGYLNRPNSRGYIPEKMISESESGIKWEQERINCAEKTWSIFLEKWEGFVFSEDSPALWWIAGLTSIADWIGSDERFFPTDGVFSQKTLEGQVSDTINQIGLSVPEMIPDLEFEEIFGFSPNDLQQNSWNKILSPGVYVIEAPMGMGKTEAALGAAYKLICKGEANGIFFALPTQVTSNRIHLRMQDFLNQTTVVDTPSQIIHGNSWLLKEIPEIEPGKTLGLKGYIEDAREGINWFHSTKRSLLAPFGVGTIDQALLGVVAAKHFFIRHFALAGKVVILDEIHSYDLYTGTLIEKLIETLENLGCTVIILSATLTAERRNKILSDSREQDKAYPLISGKTGETFISSIPVLPPDEKEVMVSFMDEDPAFEEAVELSKKGGTVLWICNTVDAAQKQYEKFSSVTHDRFPVGLLHSRFPFWRREELEEEWINRFGKVGDTRCGSILVATQVVEQSVDLDADLLVTELAPTDMLLQRIGRLWRHQRSSRPVDKPQVIVLKEKEPIEALQNMNADQIKTVLGSKAYVYSPYILLRSLDVWKHQVAVKIPSDIRGLLEATYQVLESEPEGWMNLFDESYGEDLERKRLAQRNTNLWQLALEDQEGVQTRLNEMPTMDLVLCRSASENEIQLIDEMPAKVDRGNFVFHTAKAIHKNLVRIPEHHFLHVSSDSILSRYLHSNHAVGIVADDGAVMVEGLKEKVTLRYAPEIGLKIEKF